MENINVDFTNPDELRGYLKGLKACKFMIGLGAEICRKQGVPFNPLNPIARAIEDIESKHAVSDKR